MTGEEHGDVRAMTRDEDDGEGEAGSDDQGNLGRRAMRRAFRKDEILRTALELVTEGGIDAVTTTELAKRTGAALGALYRFFPSKQAVIAALQVKALEDLAHDLDRVAVDARARAAEAPPRVRALVPIIAVADAFFAQHKLHPARYRLIDEIVSKPAPVYSDDDARVLEVTIIPILTNFAGLVSDYLAVVPNPSVDVVRLPLVMWGALHGVTHFIKRDRLAQAGQPQSGDIAGTLVRTLVQGIGASADDVDEAIKVLPPTALRMGRPGHVH